MSLLCQLQQWYAFHCDGDWEHSYGIRLDTLDNPGWYLTIDLKETLLENVAFSKVSYGNPECTNEPWLICRKAEFQFVGMCSVQELEKMLSIFLKWAKNNTDTSPWDAAVQKIIEAISSAKSLEALREVYCMIDNIPNEHLKKAEMYTLFYKKWDEMIDS